jgi:hypothetical protein
VRRYRPFQPVLVALLLTVAAPSAGATAKCPTDSVPVGAICVDAFEASVWLVPDPAARNAGLVKKIAKGKATAAALAAAGAVALGCGPTQAVFPPEFPADGDWTPVAGASPPTPGVYALSLPGVAPAGCVSWFQASQACALSGKRLPSNEEWQRAATGTPNLGLLPEAESCNTNGTEAAPTGSLADCVSSWGASDMVGNLWEWVADWASANDNLCDIDFHGDLACMGGNGGSLKPGAIRRGGGWADGAGAGPFAAISSVLDPVPIEPTIGFRCAR